jgi:hypothetical protein
MFYLADANFQQVVNQLQQQGIWDSMGLCDATVINKHLKRFQEGKKDQWEQLARDVWRVGSELGQNGLKE